jgi:hypothetical protein
MSRTSPEAAAAAALAIPDPKLPPPKHLPREQATVWRDITARLPADQFSGDNAGTLELYCQHIVFARRLAAEIERYTTKSFRSEEKLKIITKLMQLHAMHSRCAGLLAVRLGLALVGHYDRGQQALNKRKAEISSGKPTPWSDWGEVIEGETVAELVTEPPPDGAQDGDEMQAPNSGPHHA